MNLRQEVTNTNGKYLVALILWSLFIIVCFGIVLHMVAKPVDKKYDARLTNLQSASTKYEVQHITETEDGVVVKYKKKGDN
mgnify:CR=1 FL=1